MRSRGTQLGLRADDALAARLDALAEELTRRALGVKVSRAAAAMAALEKGLVEMEVDLDLAPAKKAPKRSK